MFLRILKFSATAWKTGRAHGHPAPRHPLAWLPLLLALPVVAASLLFLFVLFLLLLPLMALTGGIAWLSLGRKRRAFAEQAERGIPFAKFEGGLPILEAEVVRAENRERSAREG